MVDAIGYKGWMHADGYAGFNELYRSGRIHEVACTVGLNRPYGDVIDAGAEAAVMFEIRRDLLGTGPRSRRDLPPSLALAR
jgi:hypothetical protein